MFTVNTRRAAPASGPSPISSPAPPTATCKIAMLSLNLVAYRSFSNSIAACSFFPQYQCGQYPDHCLHTIVQHWDVPLQQAYLDIAAASGHGGFVHSCFLGAYWNSPPYPNPVLAALPVSEGGTGNKTTMWWNQIRVGGVSMRDAVHAWWNGSDTSKTACGTAPRPVARRGPGPACRQATRTAACHGTPPSTTATPPAGATRSTEGRVEPELGPRRCRRRRQCIFTPRVLQN